MIKLVRIGIQGLLSCVFLLLSISAPAGAAPSNVAAWTRIGATNSSLGGSVGTAGDFNCDGTADLLIGVPDADSLPNGTPLWTNGGWVGVWYGGATLPPQPSDLPDWFVFGGVAGTNQTGSQMGAAVAAGDVNRDGCDDVIATAPGASFAGTVVNVFFGSASGPATSFSWRRFAGSFVGGFGTSVASGDVNGDGTADIIVGAPDANVGLPNEGAVVVWLGSQFIGSTPDGSNDADWVARSGQVGAHLGTSVASAGDVDRDGDDEVLAGAPDWDGAGPVADSGIGLIWLGSPVFAATVDGTRANASWSMEIGVAGARVGASVAGVGDLDGDGYADVLVAAPDYDNPFVVGTKEGVVLGTRGGPSGPASNVFGWFHPGQFNLGRLGASVASAGDVNGDGRGDYLMGEPGAQQPTFNVRGRVHLLLGRATSGLAGNPASDVVYTEPGTGTNSFDAAQYGSSVATAGDWNNDGFSDIVVGAPLKSSAGQAFVYLGRGETLASAPIFTQEGPQASATLGLGLAFAGDINHDGFTDFVAGAPLYESAPAEDAEGRFFVTYGGPCGPACAPFQELIIAGQRESNQVGAQLGYSASGAGDVNGDGYADVVVGAPLFDTERFCGPRLTCPVPNVGLVKLYLGSAGGLNISQSLDLMGPAPILGSPQQDAQFGYSVANAGDVNGDGFGDVIVGAPFGNVGLANQGRAYLYLGSASGLASTPSWSASGTQANARFGIDVAGAGDVNGDGFSDVIIGADGHGSTGAAYVYLGRPTNASFPQGLAATPIRTYFGTQIGSTFGVSVATAGDLNRDGFADVVVGDPTYLDDPDFGPQIGRVNVYHGALTGPSPTASRVLFGEYSQAGPARFGSGVAGAGDVDGDGFGDLLVGDNWASGPGGGFAFGKAYVFHGSASGVSAPPARTFQDCPTEFCDYGRDVAGAGDVNGDGFSDVLIGAYLYTNGATNQGAAFLHLGNEGRGTALRPLQALGFGSAPLALLGMTQDLFEASLDLKSAAGRTDVQLELEVKPLGVNFDGLFTTKGVFQDNVNTSRDALTVFLGNPGSTHHWRARLRSASPLFGRSRWISLPENAPLETDVRVFLPEPGLGSVLLSGIGVLLGIDRMRRGRRLIGDRHRVVL